MFELDQWRIRAIIRGYRKREINMWRITRWQTWLLSCMMGGKADSPHKFYPLPLDAEDKEVAKDMPTDEEINALIAECRAYNEAHSK